MNNIFTTSTKSLIALSMLASFMGCGDTDTGNDNNTTSSSSSSEIVLEPSLCTQIDANTRLSEDTTFSDECYSINGNLVVEQNSLLTIDAGTVLFFAQRAHLEVRGALKAVGNEKAPIYFTSSVETSGYWRGIIFEDSLDDRNELANVVIEYAGAKDNTGRLVALQAKRGTHLKVRDSLIHYSGGYGFEFGDEAVISEFTNVISTKNRLSAGKVGVMNLSALDDSSDFSGNYGDDYIIMKFGKVTTNQTFKALNVPVFAEGSTYVEENQLLTIEAGSSFIYGSSSFIDVRGALNADANETHPIVFSGEGKTAGSWGGITFFNTSNTQNILDNCVVEYAGYNQKGAVLATYTSSLTVSNTIIRDNLTYGLWASSDTTLSETSNTYTNNADGDVFRDQ